MAQYNTVFHTLAKILGVQHLKNSLTLVKGVDSR